MKTTTVSRAFTFMLYASALALQAAPAFAQFTGTGTQATNWVVQLLTPLIPLACVGIAIGCWMGKINWPWFGAAVVGTALFFGRDQVVSLFRGWVGA